MNKSLTAFIILLATLVSAHAIPPQMTPEAKVSGTVVDYERASGLVALKDAQGIDKKLRETLMHTERSKTKRWLESLDKNYMIVEIKKEDVKAIKKGETITITDYQYGVDLGFILVSYSSLKLGQK